MSYTIVEGYRFKFGKYAGKTTGEVMQEDPGYFIWLEVNSSQYRVGRRLMKRAREATKNKGVETFDNWEWNKP